jgi:hypothetical protein
VPVLIEYDTPEGPRERELANGYSIETEGGWLLVRDRNGTVIAAHAAGPGTRARQVEHAVAQATTDQTGRPLALAPDPDTVWPSAVFRAPDDADPEHWARVFVEQFPSLTSMEGHMVGWFAEALRRPLPLEVRRGDTTGIRHIDLGTAGNDGEPLEDQIARLAGFIAEQVPGEPSRSEGAVDTAIRLLRDAYAPADLDDTDPALIDELRRLGDHWGPLGVALTAAALSSPFHVVHHLTHRDLTVVEPKPESVLEDPVLIIEPGQRVRVHGDPEPWYVIGKGTTSDRYLDVSFARGDIRGNEAEQHIVEQREGGWLLTQTVLDSLTRISYSPLPEDDGPITASVDWDERPERSPLDGVTLTYGELRRLIALHVDCVGKMLTRHSPWEDAARYAEQMSSGELALRLRDVLGNIDHEPTTRCTLRIGDHVSVEDDEGKGLSGTVESWAPNRQQTYVEVLVRVGG